MKPEPKVAEVASFRLRRRPLFDHQPQRFRRPRNHRASWSHRQADFRAAKENCKQEAEKAVQAAVAKQVNDVVREALSSIDDTRLSSVREYRSFFPARIEAMKLSLKEESTEEMAAQWKRHGDAIEAGRKR